MRRSVLALALAGCSELELAPIEIDVSTNCNEVEILTIVPQIESAARPWHTIVGAALDRVGGASGWLLVVRGVEGGLDQLALVHVDAALQVDRDVAIDVPVGLVDQFELVPSATVGVVYLTQRAPGTFFVRRYDASLVSPLSASSANLATIWAPCDPDGDLLPDSCDASQWYQDLVFFGDDPGQPYALTFPPSSADERIGVTPTPLDDSLGHQWPPNNERTLYFKPTCDNALTVEEEESCAALLAGLSYPVLESSGLARDLDNGITVLALYREVKNGEEPGTTADLPVLLFGLNEIQEPSGFLRVSPELPAPRNQPPRGVAVDSTASYILYTSTDGAPVLARAAHSSPTPQQLERVDFADGMTLLQLDEDVALHRIANGTWEILKLFPDAPQNSVLTVHDPEADVEAVIPGGRGMFVVRTAGGEADLVQVRCAVATIP